MNDIIFSVTLENGTVVTRTNGFPITVNLGGPKKGPVIIHSPRYTPAPPRSNAHP